jgi:hypothetical protein
MNNSKIPLTPKVRIKQQKIGLIVLGSVVAGIVTLLAFSDMGGAPQKPKQEEKEEYKVTIADPSRNAKTEDRWLVTAQEKIDNQESKVDNLQFENQRLKEEIEGLQSEREMQEEKFQNLETKIELLASKMTETQISPDARGSNRQYTDRETIEPHSSITTITFDDNGNDDSFLQSQATFNTQEGYIPQGSYAPAKIISAVDAQVGVSSQSNPKPVLLRIMGDAKSAMFKDKKLSVDITGCLITAGAIGELSSEKVYIKLSKMTCAKNNEEVMEVPVQGYVSAKGSNGIRGEIIMKEGSMIGKSFLAGMVGSLGQAYSQSLAPPLTFGGGTTTVPPIAAGDALKRGVGGGLGSSGNQISSYLIKRAEQYQPVISIPSGIEVEVVFLDGFFLDGRSKEKINNTTTNEE